MGNSAKRSAREISRAERAKQAAELRIAGKTWQQIGEALGCDTSTAYRLVEDYTADLPKETTETLRATLLARAEDAYRDMHTQRDKLKTPQARINADAKILGVLEKHARIGRVIQEAAPITMTQNQSQHSWDVSKLSPERVRQLHEIKAELEGKVSPLAKGAPEATSQERKPVCSACGVHPAAADRDGLCDACDRDEGIGP